MTYFLKKRIFIMLIMCSVSAGLAFAQTENIPYIFDIVRLPTRSFIYPDTFAVYWKPDNDQKQAGVASIKLKYLTTYDVIIHETDFTEDSIIAFTFDDHYVGDEMHVLQWDIRKRVPTLNYRKENALIILSWDDEIEALRALVQNAFRWQNLKLLADAYERKQCFVNAYYVYTRLLDIDPEKGKGFFIDFLSRNRSKLAISNGVHR